MIRTIRLRPRLLWDGANLSSVPDHHRGSPAGWLGPQYGASQWITVNNSSLNAHGPTQTFKYTLNLTNIPVGAEVHITGTVADDDNATISANGSGSFFTNFAQGVVNTNFATFQIISPVVFVAGTTNTVNIAVANNGGFSTGLNLDLTGSYYTALTSTVGLGIVLTPTGLTPNQTSVINTINQINVAGVADSFC